MAQVYTEEFHEFLETYGELLDQVESTRDELETIQDEVSSMLDDLYGNLEETKKLLQDLENQVWQFRTRADAKDSIVKEQKQVDEDGSSSFTIPDPADEKDPFGDIWKS